MAHSRVVESPGRRPVGDLVYGSDCRITHRIGILYRLANGFYPGISRDHECVSVSHVAALRFAISGGAFLTSAAFSPALHG